MSEQPLCWVCHRSEKEISAFADMETPGEREIVQQMTQVARFKDEFIQSADGWRKGVPKEFREFGFTFVTSNPDQFKSIRIANGLLGEIAAPSKLLGEIAEAKKLTVDWLVNVAPVLRKGDGEVTGFGPLSHFERADRDSLKRMLDQFEAKWHRRIGADGGKGANTSGYQQGFEDLKLIDGLEFMIAAGTLYYDVQSRLLDMAKREEIKSKPKRGVLAVPVDGYPPIPLCSVCVDLMREVSSRQMAVAPSVPQKVSATQH